MNGHEMIPRLISHHNASWRQPVRVLPRRGMTVVVVLMLLAMALAVSYAMMRTQVTSVQIQNNTDRRAAARQAAMAGLATGLRKIRQSNWAGVGSTMSGQVTALDSYQVTFQAGDPRLAPGDSEYEKVPYRVTIQSIGFADDPLNPGVRSQHSVSAVVELLPRKMPNEPIDWSKFQQYTVWQGGVHDFRVELPSRIEGAVRAQGKLYIAEDAPNDVLARDRYLQDLEGMRAAGMNDDRPLNGPVHFDDTANPIAFTRLLRLNTPYVRKRFSEQFAADWIRPVSLTTYQIYPGGPIYNVPTAALTLENVTLAADPLTNPLGLFYNNGNVEVRSNVTIRGTLLCAGNVRINGNNILLEPVNLPPLYATTQTIRLPALTCNDLTVESNAQAEVKGFVAAFRKLQVKNGTETTAFSITGRVVVSEQFEIRRRDEWNSTNWTLEHAFWQSQKLIYPYFPQFVAMRGRSYQPRITIKPDLFPITYHWKKPNDPVYVPHPNDGALQWELVGWQDNP